MDRLLYVTAMGLVGILCGFVSAPRAAEVNNSGEYQACMAQARKSPADAYVRAVRWRDLGGGSGAEHCAATALMGMGLYGDAAVRLESLAQTSKTEAPIKAQLLGQATQAWLLDGKPERAEATASVGLSLTPDNPELLIDRAQAKAARRDYVGALNDLDKTITLDAENVDALVFRATAKRYLDDLDGAMKDLNRALNLDINHIDALFERGIVYRLKVNNAAARADWLMVLSLAPDSVTATAARKNIERMDVKTQ